MAQRAAAKEMLPPSRSTILAEFIEHEPLTAGERPALRCAVRLCKDQDATLLIGKIDRMRNGVRWLSFVRELGVRFRGVDAPHINHLSYNLLVIADLHWRRELGLRVSQALANAKNAGTPLGGDRGNAADLRSGPAQSAKVRRAKADQRGASTMEEIKLLRYRGVTSLDGMATRLNQMGHEAPRGGLWSAAQVRRVIMKFER